MIKITSKPYAVTRNGEQVVRYTMTNSNGMSVSVLSYGCIIQNIMLKGADGKERDVVLGYDNLMDYESSICFFGACVGRYANRIKNAEFELNGITYKLKKNLGEAHLHGVLSFQVFEGEIEDDGVCFKRISLSEDEGYPGNMSIEVRYKLTEDNALEIDYKAVSDEDTVVNLTNHTYFNLNGQDGSTILDHKVTIDSDKVTEIDRCAMQTGNYRYVENTPMDFREEKTIGRDINVDYDQLNITQGYDLNYIINSPSGKLRKISTVKCDKSGIMLETYTTEPAVQFYAGNFLAAVRDIIGKNQTLYPKYGGFCLETQHSPCSPNYPQFPSTVLKQGEVYSHKTIYKFVVE